jgi:hypothetical protein
MKKFISLLLVISLLAGWTGCYSMYPVSKKEFKENNGDSGAEVITKGEQEYRYERWNYYIKSDTLFGEGIKIEHDNEYPYSNPIVLDSIAVYNIAKMSGGKTVLFSVAAIAGFAVLFAAIVLISISGGEH